MTCNTTIDYGDQEEWTPYIAFPIPNAKERFLSYPMKLKDKILSKNTPRLSSPSEAPSVFKKRLLVKLNLNVRENLCDDGNGQITEDYRLNEINTCSFLKEKTGQVWDKLHESCKTKPRTHWEDSLENNFFLRTLKVKKKSTRSEKEYRDASIWNLQRCTCKDFRKTNALEIEKRSEGIIDSDEECSSLCLCPNYFISKSGVVFGSLEEKQCFDDKMDKMNQVFKSELQTIKEQHARLREDLIPKLQDNEI